MVSRQPKSGGFTRNLRDQRQLRSKDGEHTKGPGFRWACQTPGTPRFKGRLRWVYFPEVCKQALQTRLVTREHGFSLPLGMQPCWENRQCHPPPPMRATAADMRATSTTPSESLPTLAYELANDPAKPMELVRLAVFCSWNSFARWSLSEWQPKRV